MPVYSYKCPSCDGRADCWSTIANYDPDAPVECIDCHVPMHRTYDPLPFQMPMDGHFNPSVGRYVTGKRDLTDGLKAASVEATERTGIEHDFKPVDLRDREALGVTEEGLGDQAKARQDEGKPALKLDGLKV